VGQLITELWLPAWFMVVLQREARSGQYRPSPAPRREDTSVPCLQPSARPGCWLSQARGGGGTLGGGPSWTPRGAGSRSRKGISPAPRAAVEVRGHWGAAATRSTCGICGGIAHGLGSKALGTAAGDQRGASLPGRHLQTPVTPRLSMGSPAEMLLLLGNEKARFTESQNSRGWKGPLWVI